VVGDHINATIVVLMSIEVADLTCHKQLKYRLCAIVLRSKDVQRWAEKQGLSLSPWDVRMAIAVEVVSKSINAASIYFASVECREKNYDILLVENRRSGSQFPPSTITKGLEPFDLHVVGWGALTNAHTKQKLNADQCELLYTREDDDDAAAAAADHGKVQHKHKRKASGSSTSITQTKPKKQTRTAPAQSSDADANCDADAEYDADDDAASMPHSAAAGLSAEFMSKAVKDLRCHPTATSVVHALISRIECLSNVAGSALMNAAESLNADELLIDKVSMQRSVDCCKRCMLGYLAEPACAYWT
jgi:hypothetical protein